MKTRDDSEQRVRSCARALLERAGLLGSGASSSSRVDLERIAELLDASIVIDPLVGATARLLQIEGRARIFVSDHDADPGAVRFSIAHELGHLALGHTVAASGIDTTDRRTVVERLCTPLATRARTRGGDEREGLDIERAADVFASELLFPAPIAAPWCRPAPITLDPIRALASRFGGSLFAAAMRFVELSPECCCLVYCEAARVRWAKPSATWRAWIPRGRSIDPRSAAFDFFQPGGFAHDQRDTTQTLSVDVWIPSASVERASARAATNTQAIEITEHAVALPLRGAAFSVLWSRRTL